MFSERKNPEDFDCSCLECLKRSPIFNYLTKEELLYFNENRYSVKYKPGEVIFKQGTAITHVVSFTSGLAKIYIEGLNNRNLILKLLKSGDMLGGPGMFVDFKHHFTATALTESTACFIDVKVFNEVIQNNKEFSFNHLKHVNQQTLNNFKKFISLTQKQMPGRIADALLYLHDHIYKANPFSCNISRQDLADMTAMSKESAIRILKQFKDEDIIDTEGDYINIMDFEELRNISIVG